MTPAPDDFPAADLSREIVRACLGAGFAAAGICRAEPTSREREFRAWLGAGRHGTMSWLAERVEERFDPRKLIAPSDGGPARSLIVVADQYADRDGGSDAEFEAAQRATLSHTPLGRIARYARGPDYHEVVKKRLHTLRRSLARRFPGARFRPFADTAPVLEREHAARAGLGFIGKHTLLINPRTGSYLALGGIATTLDLSPPPEHAPIDERCGTCTRCIDACPTGAITPWSVDSRRCISYLTIEHRGPIDPAIAPAIGDRLLGCDVCQEVCPFNRADADSITSQAVREASAVYFAAGRRRAALPALEVARWTAADRAAELSHSAVKRATLAMLRRNADIVASNCSMHTPPSAPPQ